MKSDVTVVIVFLLFQRTHKKPAYNILIVQYVATIIRRLWMNERAMLIRSAKPFITNLRHN